MKTLSTRLLIALLLVSAGLNFALGRIVVNSRVRHTSPAVAKGATMPALRVNDLEGRPVTIPYLDVSTPTIVYLFSPHCVFCKKNVKAMASLQGQLSGSYRFIGVSLAKEDLKQFIKESDLHFPIYTDLDPAIATAYKAGATPQTFVIGRDGRLQSMWTGYYSDAVKQEIESFFRVRIRT
jgi:peroxiredoxin